MKEMLEKLPVTRIESGQRQTGEDVVADEVPLTLVLNGDEIATLLCSPDEPDALALGYLLSEGIISRESEISSLQYHPDGGFVKVKVPPQFVTGEGFQGGRLVGSGCANAVPFYRDADAREITKLETTFSVGSDHLRSVMKEFQKAGEAFKLSGGTHSCAICDAERIIFNAEDIGRHNALDKVVGRCFLDDIPTEDKVILTTGRVSSEIVLKIAKLEAPIVVSRSAPTALAVDIGKKLGLTIVGFARGKRMNIYSHEHRIL